MNSWKSYSCVGVFGKYEKDFKKAVKALEKLTAIAEDPKNDFRELKFTVIDKKRDYFAAISACYLQDKRLAEIDNQEKIDMLENLIEEGEKYWVVGSHKCTTREKTTGEADTDCNENHQFICAVGK